MSRISNLIKKAQAYKGQEFKQPRMFVPSGMIVPETAKNSMARQLYQAGIITKDDYEKMLGVSYDIDDVKLERFDDETFSAYEEEFKLSQLSEYYDDYGEGEDEGRGNGNADGDSDRKEAVQSGNSALTGTDVQQDNVEVVPNEQKSEP